MCHVVFMLVYCNCMTTVLCWSLVCCISSCNDVHVIDYSVYLYTKEHNNNAGHYLHVWSRHMKIMMCRSIGHSVLHT